MKKGEYATIKMQKTLCIETVLDETKYPCEVLQYDKQTEVLYLAVVGGILTNISLDAFYECVVEGEESVRCTGKVQERYCEGTNAVVKFQIKNGFYKINIK